MENSESRDEENRRPRPASSREVREALKPEYRNELMPESLIKAEETKSKGPSTYARGVVLIQLKEGVFDLEKFENSTTTLISTHDRLNNNQDLDLAGQLSAFIALAQHIAESFAYELNEIMKQGSYTPQLELISLVRRVEAIMWMKHMGPAIQHTYHTFERMTPEEIRKENEAGKEGEPKDD